MENYANNKKMMGIINKEEKTLIFAKKLFVLIRNN